MIKKYPEYKDSGVEWIGQIPTHWEMRKISRSFDLIGSGTTPKSENSEYYDNGTINWIITGDLNDNMLKNCSKKITTKAITEYSTLKIYPVGTLLIAMYGATIGKISLINIEGCTNQACCALSKSKYLTNKFAFYWFLSNRKHIINLSFGGGQPNISQEVIRSLKIQTPPHPEQQSIANYLDKKTHQIDTLIEKRQKQIDLLKEQRTTIINHVVTKGLDPDVKMKDSGIEWLGEIPAHWEVYPAFRTLIKQKLINKGLLNNNVLSLSYGRIVKRDVEENYGLLPESFETYQIVSPGNIILRLTDLQNDKVSLRVGLVKEKGIITSAYICLRPIDMNPDFGYFLLHSYDTIKIFYNIGGGVRQTMRYEDLRRFPILIPTIQEQHTISSFLNKKTKLIDVLIEKKQQQIELLKEQHTILISDAVTGTIDVRGEVPS